MLTGIVCPLAQADLERIRSLLLQRSGAVINITADARTMSAADKAVQEFLASLPATSAPAATWSGSLPRVNEAFTVPTQVGQPRPLQAWWTWSRGWCCAEGTAQGSHLLRSNSHLCCPCPRPGVLCGQGCQPV